MQRRSIPAILEEIGALLEIEGDNPFKAKAYFNAAKVLAGLDDLDSLISQGRIREIKGIGETLSAKIIEYHETGKMAYHEELKKRLPVTLIQLLQVPNLGVRKIRALYEELGVASLVDLECACKENRLVRLPRFGEKTQDRILRGIEFLRRHEGEFLFGEVYPLAADIAAMLGRAHPDALVEICGSVRRKSEVVRNIDILAGTEDRAGVSRYFTSMPWMEEVLADSGTETSIRTSAGITAMLRVVDKSRFPAPSSILPEAGSIGRGSRPWRRQGVLPSPAPACSRRSGPWRCKARPTCTAGWASHMCRPSCGRIGAR